MAVLRAANVRINNIWLMLRVKSINNIFNLKMVELIALYFF